MKLDNQTLALIAVGAAVSANCQQCLERTVGIALQCGVESEQIAQAIEIGKRVRQGAATKLDQFAESRNYVVPAVAGAKNGECACS